MIMDIKGALAGTKVVDLSRLLPGPYCSMILADHGARVIAVEDGRFKADGLFLDVVNRNKEHMTLNLKTDAGKQILYDLVADADVFMEGFRPGVAKSLGMDYPVLSGLNSGLVYCSISGYGQTGPYANRSGHDVNYLGVSGVLDLIGPKEAPCIPGIQMADVAGGAMNAAMGILMALLERRKSRKGQYIDISMTDGMLGFLALPLFISRVAKVRRSDFMLSHRYACYTTYETEDGRFISIGAVENRFWKRLCEVLDAPFYADLQYDEAKREEILRFFKDKFREKTAAQWEEVLKDQDVCFGPVQTMEQVLEDPFFRDREMVVDLDCKPQLGIPVKLSRTPGSIRTPAPEFGQNTDAILTELGYSPDDIRRFKDTGVV